MNITDAQIHIWNPDPDLLAGARDPDTGHERLELEALIKLLDGAGVDRAILMPPKQEGSSNDAALAAARRFPDRLGAMGVVDLTRKRGDDLEHWLTQTGMLGIRVNFGADARRGSILDDQFEWLWRSADVFQIPMMVFAPGQTVDFGVLAQRYPDLNIILDHLNLGGRDFHAEGLEKALEQLCSLSPHRNIAVKISGLPCYTDEPYPFRNLTRHIREIVESFGPNRSMWGSDSTRLPCSYADWLNTMLEAIDFLGPQDQAAVMNDTVCAYLKWQEQ